MQENLIVNICNELKRFIKPILPVFTQQKFYDPLLIHPYKSKTLHIFYFNHTQNITTIFKQIFPLSLSCKFLNCFFSLSYIYFTVFHVLLSHGL